MMSYRALAEIVLTVVCLFYAAFQIGGFIRGAAIGDSASIKMLVFLAVVALAGGLWGAHATGVGVARARHNL